MGEGVAEIQMTIVTVHELHERIDSDIEDLRSRLESIKRLPNSPMKTMSVKSVERIIERTQELYSSMNPALRMLRQYETEQINRVEK
jgi:hypothetical protein